MGKTTLRRIALQGTERGLTLIELLMVIAIISSLAYMALVSMSIAREKARDTKRIADIREVKIALEMYFDEFQTFPPSLAAPYDLPAILSDPAKPYLPTIPNDPLGTSYLYIAASGTGAVLDACDTAPCQNFGLFALLERAENPALAADPDIAVSTIANGTSIDCGTTAGVPQPGGNELCYDVTQ